MHKYYNYMNEYAICKIDKIQLFFYRLPRHIQQNDKNIQNIQCDYA